VRLFVTCILSAVVAAAGQRPAQPPVFRAAVNTVSVWATVRDSQGRFVPNLKKEDFDLRVGGKPTDIAVFSSDEQPVTVCLLIDMSGSVTQRFLRMRDGAIHFVRALKKDDRARIGTFGAEIAISPVLTGDRAVLEEILREELWPSGSTPLWGAMGAALESLQGEPGRRVLLTMTDGLATPGSLPGYASSSSDVRRMLRDPGLIVYAIGIKDNLVMQPSLEADLVEMALSSGGASFELTDDADLEQTFTRVAEELRSQYLIGFVPDQAAGTSQRMSIRVKGYQVRSRSSVDVDGRR
jgi:Ca-activated chloride channel family protein